MKILILVVTQALSSATAGYLIIDGLLASASMFYMCTLRRRPRVDHEANGRDLAQPAPNPAIPGPPDWDWGRFVLNLALFLATLGKDLWNIPKDNLLVEPTVVKESSEKELDPLDIDL